MLCPDRPYLAQLAVAAQARAPAARAVAETAVELTIDRLPERLAADQLDAILGMVDEALRAQLESRIMEHREYRSELFRGIYEQGQAEGKAESILAVLSARGIPVSDTVRERIRGCHDIDTLDAWLQRAAVASTAAAVVRAKAAVHAKTAARTRRPTRPAARSKA
ncbi:MAG: hypothetical protein QM820_47305 [Minicystis sp.]